MFELIWCSSKMLNSQFDSVLFRLNWKSISYKWVPSKGVRVVTWVSKLLDVVKHKAVLVSARGTIVQKHIIVEFRWLDFKLTFLASCRIPSSLYGERRSVSNISRKSISFPSIAMNWTTCKVKRWQWPWQCKSYSELLQHVLYIAQYN